MRILVTGAGGMLGHDVRLAAAARGHIVLALTHAQLDITDAQAVATAVRAARPELVINCAAYTAVDRAESDRDAAFAVNAIGAGNVARASSATHAPVIHISTDYVFDGAKTDGPYLESDATGPRSVYGASKLAGERAVAQLAPGLHTIVRSSWLFGVHGACFPDTMLRLARERETLTVVDDQRGCPTYTADLAAALLELAERDRRPLGLVHLAAGSSCTWFELARETLRLERSRVTVTPCASTAFPRPAPRPAYSVLRSERGAELPTLRDWRAGLRAYLAARRAQAAQVSA